MYDVFSLPPIEFPKGFLWGSATAGHQVEGDNVHSQNWAREQEGKCEAPSGKACNHYVLYKQDVQLLKDLGHRGYRMSVEWSRIEPEEGQYDQASVDHYLDLLRLLKEAGIQVFVTLHHFTHPLWLEKKGGLRTTDNLPAFERYLNFIVPKIAPYVDSWNVINEFNLGSGENAIARKLSTLQYHARGYHVIKQYSKAPVSSAHAFVVYFPSRWYDESDQVMVRHKDLVDNEFFFHAIRTGEVCCPGRDGQLVPEVKGSADYWAVNYYSRQMVDSRKADGKGARYRHKLLKMVKVDQFLEEMFPEGLQACVERLNDKPVYITENGCVCDDDRFRMVYLALHLSALHEAIQNGVDVRGYLYWSLMDNYEWGSFVPQFGLVHVDFKTFAREPKPSAYFYRDIIQANGMKPEMIRKYLKELPTL